jgi:hypothetical protein
VIGIIKETSLPLIYLENGLVNSKIGEKVSDQLIFAGELLAEIYKLYNVRIGILKSESLEIELARAKVIFPLQGDRQVLLGSLSLILSQLNAEPQNFRMSEEGKFIVDLRFKNPIIK